MPHPNDLTKARPWESGLGTPVIPVPTLPLSHIPRLHLQYKGYSLVAKKMGFGVRLLPGASVRNPTHNNVMREEA